MSCKLNASLALATLSLAALGLGAARPAQAQTAFTIDPAKGDFDAGHSNNSSGYTFTTAVGSPVTVISLGYFDNGGSLNASHNVGIFSEPGAQGSGVLLTSAVVPMTGGTQDGLFSYATLTTPLVLAGGSTFTIAGVESANDPLFEFTTATGIQGLTYGNAAYYYVNNSGANGALLDPNNLNGGSNAAYFGPNFQIASPSAAPEPSQFGMLALMGLGLGGLVLRARRAKSASAAA